MELGKYQVNNIYNEDCYEAIKNIPDKSIDLVYIDPPYKFCKGGKGHGGLADRKAKSNQEINSLDTGLTKERLRIDANKEDNRNDTRFVSQGFTNDLLDELCRVMKNIYIYIWCNKEQLRQIIDYFDDKGCSIDLLTWHKTNPIPVCNSTYLPDTEYCVLARDKGCRLYGTPETKHKYYISTTNKDDKEMYLHPTIKPLEMVKNHIFNSTKEGDIVLDCFMGSGTTALACKELNRQYIGFELEKEYWQIAVDRVNGLTVQDRKNKEKGIQNIFDYL